MLHNVTDNTIEDNNRPAYAISPDVLGHKILPYCAPREEAMFQMASKHVYSIFNQATNQVCIWKFRLQHHFGITDRVLNTFESLRQHHGVTFSYRKMYIGLIRLHASRARMEEKYLFHAVTDKSKQFLVLASCADEISLLPWIEAGDELEIFYQLCQYTGWHEVIMHFCRLDTRNYSYTSSRNLLNQVALSGDLDLLESLLEINDASGTRLFRSVNLTLNAVKSNNVAMVRRLFGREDCKSYLTPDLVYRLTLAAVQTHNINMLKFFCELKNIESTAFIIPDIDVLNEAAKLGNFSMVEFLLSFSNLLPTVDTLANAMKSGNVQLVQWLMARKKGDTNFEIYVIDLSIDHDRLLTAVVSSGNIEMVSTVFSTTLGKLFRPTADTLMIAIDTGNLEIVRQLRWLANNLDISLHPGENTVLHAIKSGNIKMMEQEVALFENATGKPLRLSPNLLEAAFQSGSIETVRALLIKAVMLTQKLPENQVTEKQLANVMCQHSINAIEYCVKSNNAEMLAFHLKLRELADYKQPIFFAAEDVERAAQLMSTIKASTMRRVLFKSALVKELLASNVESVRKRVLLCDDQELILDLHLCNNDRGESMMYMDQSFIFHDFLFILKTINRRNYNIVKSELAYRDGVRFIKANKIEFGELSLMEAYKHSPRNFFNSLRKTLETEPNSYAACVFEKIMADENNRVDNFLDRGRKLSLSNRILLEEMFCTKPFFQSQSLDCFVAKSAPRNDGTSDYIDIKSVFNP